MVEHPAIEKLALDLNSHLAGFEIEGPPSFHMRQLARAAYRLVAEDIKVNGGLRCERWIDARLKEVLG